MTYSPKVRPTFLLSRRTLVQKGLQSRWGQFIDFIHKFLYSRMIEPLGNSAGC